MFISCEAPGKRQLLCLPLSWLEVSFFSHNLFCTLTQPSTSARSPAAVAPPSHPTPDPGSQQGLRGGQAARRWGQRLCPSVWPGKQLSLLGLSRACFKGHLCLCIWFNYPLQMSAWTLPSVSWQFSSPNCMIAPLKRVLSSFGSSVSPCLYPVSFYLKLHLLLSVLSKKGVLPIIKVILYMLS